MRSTKGILACLAGLGALSTVGVAHADEPVAARKCNAAYDLFHPVPDACLEIIDTDRPHQTDTPHVVPAGHAQVEAAFASFQLGGSVATPRGDKTPHFLVLDDSYAFGLTQRLELQLFWKHAELSSRGFQAPGPLSVRAKINLVTEKGTRPAFTLVPWLFVPVAKEQPVRGGPLAFLGWELPASFELEVNTGLMFGSKPKPLATFVMAAALTWKFVPHAGVFAEAYGAWPDVTLGTGALWALTRDIQLDGGTYIGLHGDVSRATPFLGMSFRR